jgi:hypothetical protein
MAAQKLLGRDEVGVENIGFAVPRTGQGLRSRNKEDLYRKKKERISDQRVR